MYTTTTEAIVAARIRQIARQCAAGRHTPGCAHRPISPWMRRAMGLSPDTLPAKELKP